MASENARFFESTTAADLALNDDRGGEFHGQFVPHPTADCCLKFLKNAPGVIPVRKIENPVNLLELINSLRADVDALQETNAAQDLEMKSVDDHIKLQADRINELEENDRQKTDEIRELQNQVGLFNDEIAVLRRHRADETSMIKLEDRVLSLILEVETLENQLKNMDNDAGKAVIIERLGAAKSELTVARDRLSQVEQLMPLKRRRVYGDH